MGRMANTGRTGMATPGTPRMKQVHTPSRRPSRWGCGGMADVAGWDWV